MTQSNSVIFIKKLTTLQEMNNVEQLQEKIWNIAPVPYHQTFTAINNGGFILGAYAGETLVGFQYSFPGAKDGQTYLCSHMLGMLPDYRKKGLGKKLKILQRDHALSMGYKLISWTFDPLEFVNAYLNLSKLRGIGAYYYENYYGVMSDSLNKGLPSDRFLVEWWINSDHVKSFYKIESTDKTERTLDEDDGAYQLLMETKTNKHGFLIAGEPNTVRIEKNEDCRKRYAVPIPFNIQEIKNADHELAADWRLKTRQAISVLMAQGYITDKVVKDDVNNRAVYIFRKRSQLSLLSD